MNLLPLKPNGGVGINSPPRICIHTYLSEAFWVDFIKFLKDNSKVFDWSYDNMLGISLDVIYHKRYEAMKTKVDKLRTFGFIRNVDYPI